MASHAPITSRVFIERVYNYCMDKKIYYLVGSLGSTVGAYIPVILGAGGLSIWSILGGLVGGVGAIVVVYRLSK